MIDPTLSLRAKRKTLTLAVASGILALSLIGCGGSDDNSSGNAGNDNSNANNGSSNNGNNGSTQPGNNGAFSQTATWKIEGDNLKIGAVTCYDFDAQVTSDCSDNKWDIKFDNQARSPKLWSNSGDSGTGNGGVFGVIDWSDLKTYKNATQDPKTGRDITLHYNEDKSGGIFDEQPWHEYNLNGKHQLYPNNRVYMITADNSSDNTQSSVSQPLYAMQIINYYNEGGASGYPTVRWIDTALPNQVQTQTIDASNNDNWVYFNLTTGKTTTDKNAIWHVGFKRNDVVLNSGDSGSAKVGGFLAATPAGYYDAKGKLIASKFMTDGSAATVANLTATAKYNKPTSARGWVVDRKGSDLNPKIAGGFPNIDYGWYVYKGDQGHRLFVKPTEDSIGALVRSAAGNSYARLHLDQINYADSTAANPSSWVFNIDIQPAQ